MADLRYKGTHLQDALIANNVNGNWEGRSGQQNVYNLINGSVVPRDGYVYLFLSTFLEVPVEEILMRYSEKSNETRSGRKVIDW